MKTKFLKNTFKLKILSDGSCFLIKEQIWKESSPFFDTDFVNHPLWLRKLDNSLISKRTTHYKKILKKYQLKNK